MASGQVLIEIRALNHKHQDVRVKVPSELSELGAFLEQMARSALSRGRYDISVTKEGSIGGRLKIDARKIEQLLESLRPLHEALTPDQPLRLDPLLSLPEILSNQRVDQKAAQEAIKIAFEAAISGLLHMRAIEGAALASDLTERLARVSGLVREVEEGAADLVRHHQERMRARVQLLLKDVVVLQEERLEQEIALLADRSDITEELVRLRSHIAQFGLLLDDPEPVGRRLDFLLQEMGREVNTIGSKSGHAPIAHLVVTMKSEVERLREQVQNVA